MRLTKEQYERFVGQGRAAQAAVQASNVRRMNKTEARYFTGHILPRLQHGEVTWYAYEGIKLRIGEKCFYTPDFALLTSDGQLEIREVKGGFIREDAMVKLKAAAQIYPFRFFLCQYKAGEWRVREIQGG